MSLTELLAQNPIFTHFSAEEQEHIATRAVSRHYTKGEWIAYYGEIWPNFFIVEEGSVTALKESVEGRSLIVVTLGPGDVLWGLAFFYDDTPMIVSLIADEPSTIHIWSKEDLVPILLKDGLMAWELARLMVTRMQRASDIVEELAFQPVTGRLARLLLSHFGEAVDDYVSRDLTLEEMAARIGTTREMVCRQLYRFMDDGAIEINRTEFMITNREVLEKLAAMAKK
jgi:CRP-like cAMP-binding protein